ncbi:hypothetical protein J6590_098853 [Homalodisca vitripennis]|nr:hypothetical protein J6590_098853 [Homalodisca vitripennis]
MTLLNAAVLTPKLSTWVAAPLPKPQYSQDAAIVGTVSLLKSPQKMVSGRTPQVDTIATTHRKSGQSKCHKATTLASLTQRQQPELSRNSIPGSSEESKAKSCSQRSNEGFVEDDKKKRRFTILGRSHDESKKTCSCSDVDDMLIVAK